MVKFTARSIFWRTLRVCSRRKRMSGPRSSSKFKRRNPFDCNHCVTYSAGRTEEITRFTPLKAEDIKRWVQSHEQDLEAAESGGNSDDS